MLDQLECRGLVQADEVESRHPRCLEAAHVAVASAEDERDALGVEAARDEQQGVLRRAVEPVRIVDDREQRSALGGVGEQIEHGRGDQEPVRRGVGLAEAERRCQRLATRRAEGVHFAEQGGEQLKQAGEGQLGIGFHAQRPQRAEPRRALHEVVQQRRLARAGLAAHDESSAHSDASRLDDIREMGALGVAAVDHSCDRRVAAGEGRAHVSALLSDSAEPLRQRS